MTTENSILKTIPTYDSNRIEETILSFKRELKEQKEVNKALKDENYEQKSVDITNFIQRNGGQIDDQLNRLATVVDDLKKIVNENLKLEDNEELYTDVVKSDEAIAIANKLQQLKILKKTALTFLENAGITPQNIT